MEREKPIIALDFPTKLEVERFLHHFTGQRLNLKVGMELFYSEGMPFVHELKDKGHALFLDLKLHDIPNTVERSMRVLAKAGVDMVNIHAAGGTKMMTAALEGLTEGSEHANRRPLLIAVTQLTSTSEGVMNQEIGIPGSLEETVLSYARLAKSANLDGIVCSPLESKQIHSVFSKEFITVTPGIRLASSTLTDDQQRIMTPEQAAENGSTYIVVGRPITQAADPAQAYHNLLNQWQVGLAMQREFALK